jgi:diguanylate cyclase (GGDEF)-like protein
MEHPFAFDEVTIKKMPRLLVFTILLLLVIPYLALTFGLDFNASAGLGENSSLHTLLLEHEIRGYFRQILLQWSGFSLAAMTVLFSFTQYKLSNDRIALVIGVSILFSGSIEALDTLFVDGLTLEPTQKSNLDALVWTFSNSIGALILIIGLLLAVKKKQTQPIKLMTLILISALFACSTVSVLFLAKEVMLPPEIWVKNSSISRPYEFISGILYLYALFFVCPKVYKEYPSILAHCITYICIAQIFIAIYLMFLSHTPYDSAYNIAYFLKIVCYFIPCACLITNYILSYTGVLRAQKRLKLKQEELRYMASHDSLTNLFNRREFEDLLDKSISNAHRNKNSLALLLIDIDNFKATNDTFGHIHGDELLKQFSNRMVLLIRKGDILSRVGGDEFTLISPQIKSPSSARQLAERILNELNSPYLINGKLITATVSIGISIFPSDGRTSEKLMIKADLAMYKAKGSGKNTYQFYTEQLSYLQHRESEVEAHLRKALQNNEFQLHYQPKYNLVTREIVGAEILLRWENGILGHLSPNEFIPVAERSGLIIEIGNWVLNNAFNQIAAWHKEYGSQLVFALNISPPQLSNTQFLDSVKRAMTSSTIASKYIEFEITENILMDNSNEVTHVLNSIADLGIKIALDDFGKGYSSLNRLKMLPIDTLKIDKDFISDIQNEEDKVVIVDIIIKLANELGMEIIAEGIETVAQLKYLVAKKCLWGQGFLLSEPINKEKFTELAFKNKTNAPVNL